MAPVNGGLSVSLRGLGKVWESWATGPKDIVMGYAVKVSNGAGQIGYVRPLKDGGGYTIEDGVFMFLARNKAESWYRAVCDEGWVFVQLIHYEANVIETRQCMPCGAVIRS